YLFLAASLDQRTYLLELVADKINVKYALQTGQKSLSSSRSNGLLGSPMWVHVFLVGLDHQNPFYSTFPQHPHVSSVVYFDHLDPTCHLLSNKTLICSQIGQSTQASIIFFNYTQKMVIRLV